MSLKQGHWAVRAVERLHVRVDAAVFHFLASECRAPRVETPRQRQQRLCAPRLAAPSPLLPSASLGQQSYRSPMLAYLPTFLPSRLPSRRLWTGPGSGVEMRYSPSPVRPSDGSRGTQTADYRFAGARSANGESGAPVQIGSDM